MEWCFAVAGAIPTGLALGLLGLIHQANPAVEAAQGRATTQPGNYTSVPGRFRVAMPGEPKEEALRLDSTDGPRTGRLVQSLDLKTRMAYIVSYLDHFGANKSAGEILDTIVTGAVDGGRWEVLSDGKIDLAGKPGRDLQFKMKAFGVPAARGNYRAYVIDRRVYQLIVVAPEPDWNPDVAQAFLNSFTFIPDVRNQPPTSKGAAPRPRSSAPSPEPAGSAPLPDGLAAIPPRDKFGFFGQPYLDLAPNGGKLVGIRVGYIDAFGGQMIGCVQPIYQVDEEQVDGAKIGRDIPVTDAAIAPPGYFVGAIDFRQGLMLNGFQLIYFKDAGDHLDEGDSRKSEWLGDQSGGRPGNVTSSGFFVGGLQVRAGNEVNAIGLIIRKWETETRPKRIPTDPTALPRSVTELDHPSEKGPD